LPGSSGKAFLDDLQEPELLRASRIGIFLPGGGSFSGNFEQILRSVRWRRYFFFLIHEAEPMRG
jgi:hypothetical protein